MRTLRSARSWSAVWLSALMVVAAACASPTAPGRAGPAAAEAGAGAGAAEAGRAGPAAAGASPPAALEPVKVAYVNALDNAPLFVGIDRGYWQAEGIDVQTEPVQSAADAIAFLANGQLDVAVGSIAVPLFNAAQQGLDVRIIAPVAYVELWKVLLRTDLWESGAVRTLADLRGRRIYSVAPGSGANYSRLKWQESAGLRPDDVELVNMQLSDAPLAMANRQLDAGGFSDPWATRILVEGTAVVLDPGPPAERLSIVLTAGARLRHEQSELGRRFMLAFLRAIRDLQTDEQIKSDATVETFARWTGNRPELVRQLRYMPRFDPNLTVDVDNLLDQQRVHIASRATTYTDPLPADRLLDLALAEYAVQRLGRAE